MRRISVGLLGCGVVGGGFVQLLQTHAALIRERAEAEIEVTKIAVRDIERERPFVDRSLLTTRGDDVVRNGVDLVVELIGGIDPARGWIREALGRRKHVVTANKRLLAEHGGALLAIADVHRVRLAFEASVGGAVPIVRTIRHALAGDRVRSIRGVLNGTSNFILSRGAEGVPYDAALAEAQRLGYAESDPSLDVDGLDSQQKMTILAQLAFGARELDWKEPVGIREVSQEDHDRASRNGCVVRLVASAVERQNHVEVLVQPEHVPASSPLGRVTGVTNVVTLQCDAAGELSLAGPGAGSLPSASAVLSDVIEIARAI